MQVTIEGFVSFVLDKAGHMANLKKDEDVVSVIEQLSAHAKDPKIFQRALGSDFVDYGFTRS